CPNAAIPSEAAWTHSTVDHSNWNTSFLGRPSKIGPNFTLRQHNQIRPGSIQCAPYSPGEIQGPIKNGHAKKALVRFFKTRICCRGNQTLPVGMAFLKFLDHLFQQNDFSNAHTVEPGARPLICSARGEAPQLGPKPATVLAGGERFKNEVR